MKNSGSWYFFVFQGKNYLLNHDFLLERITFKCISNHVNNNHNVDIFLKNSMHLIPTASNY